MANEKKRKRTTGDDPSSSKKRSVTFSNDKLSIRQTEVSSKDFGPILAVPVGLNLPHNSMEAYQQSVPNSKIPKSDLKLILHSSEHPRMDFIGKEEFGNGAEKLLNHYIGIYDPQTGQMEMIKARKVAVRTVLRPTQEEIDELAKGRDYQTMMDQRQALGMEFGTKKSKNIIKARNENAIIATTTPKKTAATKALLDSIAVNIENMPTMDDLLEKAEQSKPRPKANLSAKRPEEVYPVDSLIPADVMRQLRVDDWIEGAATKEGVTTTSRYVSRRIASTLRINDDIKCKVLKYMLMVIEWFGKAKSTRNGRLAPRPFEIEQLGHPKQLMNGIAKRFLSQDNTLSQWHIDNLQTHIMALALFMDDYNVDLEDLKDDFRLTPDKASNLFKSIGCKIAAPTDREKITHKMNQAEASRRKFARLTLPLEFPKERVQKKRGRR